MNLVEVIATYIVYTVITIGFQIGETIHHEVYFLIMLKSIARKQERLSCDLKFVEV